METVEYDSDDDDAGSDLSSWLQKLSSGGEKAPVRGDCGGIAGRGLLTQSDTVESFRYSVMVDLESSNACDLDDIINDLCALEAQLSSECAGGGSLPKAVKSTSTLDSAASSATDEAYESRSSAASSANSSLSRESGTRYVTTQLPVNRRAALPGGGGSAPAGAAASAGGLLMQKSSQLPCAKREWTPGSSSATMSPTTASVSNGSPAESRRAVVDTRTKEEKILLAIQKIKDADIKKLFVKVFIENGDCKTLLVDETMTTYDVIQVLFDKCPAFRANVRWAVIEQIPDLFIERIVEDHEKLVVVMLNWLKVSNNRVLFLQTDDKYDLFFQPQNYLLEKKAAASCSERDQKGFLDDLFSRSGCQVPELESDLHVKIDGQKSWKKITAVLRSSGIYLKKGKASRAALQCVVQFDQMEAYRGFNWKKKHKAPSEHCFALKRADLQRKSKDGTGIKYFCCDDDYTLKRWLTGIRVAKYGSSLSDNFKKMLDATSSQGERCCAQAAGLHRTAETASHGSRDSGFSIASGGSSSGSSLDGSKEQQQQLPQPPRQLPPPLEFSDLPPPPPELLRSACSTPTSAKRCPSATASPLLRHVSSDSPMLCAAAAQRSAEMPAGGGIAAATAAAMVSCYRSLSASPPAAGSSASSTPRTSGGSVSSSSSGSTPRSSMQSLNAAASLPSGEPQQQLPAVTLKPRAGIAAPFERSQQLPPPSQRTPFERLDPSRRTCPAAPKRTSSVAKQQQPAAAVAAALAKRSSLERLADVGACSFAPGQLPPSRPPAVAAKPAAAAAQAALLLTNGSVNAAVVARSVSHAAVAARSSKASDGLALAAATSVGGGQGQAGSFLAELSTVYARRGFLAKPSEQTTTASVLCDIDDLPPPPPELLLDLPTQAVVAGCGGPLYDLPHSASNGGSDRLHYNMGQMFASQTGTIKRAPPPPPPKRQEIIAVAGDGVSLHAQQLR